MESVKEIARPDGIYKAKHCSETIPNIPREQITGFEDARVCTANSHQSANPDQQRTESHQHIHDDPVDHFGANFTQSHPQSAVNKPGELCILAVVLPQTLQVIPLCSQ